MSVLNLLLVSFFIPQQSDSLEFIYNKIEIHLQKEERVVDISTDKDFYLPGEKVFYSLRCHSCLPGEFFYTALVNEEKELISYTRSILDSNSIALGSISIPDAYDGDFLWVVTFNEESNAYSYSEVFILKPPEAATRERYDSLKLRYTSKTKYLTPATNNELLIENLSANAGRFTIVDQKDSIISDLFIRNDRVISFQPTKGKKYFLNYRDEKIPLPSVKDFSRFQSFQLNKETLNISIEKAKEKAFLIVITGKEIIWLSDIASIEDELTIDLKEAEKATTWGFILDKNFDILDQELISIEPENSEIIFKSKGDSLFFRVPDHLKGVPFKLSIVDENLLSPQKSFNYNEKVDLSKWGYLPVHKPFKTDKQKANWLKYAFNKRLPDILKNTEASVELIECAPLVYQIPEEVRINEKLEIAAVDMSGSIVNHELHGRNIYIDPCKGFDNPESLLVVSARSKGKKISLIKNSSFEEKYLNDRVAKIRLEKENIKRRMHGEDYRLKLKNLEGVTLLDEVVVSTNNDRNYNYSGRGQIVSYNEIELSDHTVTAFSLLPQIGVNNALDIQTGFISSKRRSRGAIYYGVYYPMWVIITEGKKTLYSGRDFRELKNYPAKWVIAMNKIESTPEGVLFDLKRGWRGVSGSVAFEKIFSDLSFNDNLGVYSWQYVENGQMKSIGAPKPFIYPVRWQLDFYSTQHKQTVYTGVMKSN